MDKYIGFYIDNLLVIIYFHMKKEKIKKYMYQNL